MSWVFKLIGYVTGNGVEVDANNSLKTTGPTTLSQVGFGAAAARNDDGVYTGTPTVRRLWSTETGILMNAPQNLFWDDTLNSTAQNTSKYRFAATTQTAAMAGGFLILNNSGITTANTNCAIQTFRTFPIFGNSETRVIISGGFGTATAPVANNVVEFGLFSATIPGGAIPTDGAFFRYNAVAELRGVVNYNGTETQTAALNQAGAPFNVNHDYMVIVQNDVVSFWVDRVKLGAVTLTTDAPTIGQPFSAAEQPITIRQYIGASTPVSATKFQVSDIFVKVVGPDTVRSWEVAKAGFGHMAYQGQNGGTMGSTANYANSSNPAAAVPTNTTAALGSGLGGQFWETATLALGTDGILCSFQNPTGGVTQTPRNLIIYAVSIDSTIQTSITGGPFSIAYALAFGHTSVSLATAESASFASPTTKAPRRIALGKMAVASAQAAGSKAAGAPVTFVFRAPIVVAPGEFVAIVKKNETGGTVATAGVIAHNVTFDAIFE